jgi:hypothetical protein
MRLASALALLGVALLLLPPAQAQLPVPVPGSGTTNAQLVVEVNDPGGALVPGRPYSYKVVVHYVYGPGAVVPPGQDSCATLKVQGVPAYATGNVTPDTVCFAINPTVVSSGTTVDNSTILDLNLTAEAPALDPFNVTVVADAPANGPIQAAHGEASHLFEAGFVGKVQLLSVGPVLIAGGAPQAVPLRVRNLGNGPIQVMFTNVSVPQGVKVQLPGPITLQNPGDEGTAVLTLRAPWTLPSKGDVDVSIVTQYPGRRDLPGDTPHAKFPLASKAAVPGFDPAALACLLGALALRRRR